MAMICHGTVGLQHATMAMYNAWCDRVPVYRDGRQHRRGRQAHARRRMGAFGDRHRRAGARFHQMGRPAGLAAAFRRIGGARLQDRDDAADGAGAARRSMPSCRRTRSTDARTLRIPKLAQGRRRRSAIPARSPTPPKMLVAAENPVIICDRLARTPAGMARLVELAETLQCAVIDNAGRMNFPSRHPLNQSFRRGPVHRRRPTSSSRSR